MESVYLGDNCRLFNLSISSWKGINYILINDLSPFSLTLYSKYFDVLEVAVFSLWNILLSKQAKLSQIYLDLME